MAKRKIKVNKDKTKNILKRKKIPKNIRIPILAIITLILVFSAYTAYAAYQKPTTAKQTVITTKYGQTGSFNYLVYLKNNTVYNKTVLYPGEGSYFKQIVDHINLSFTYSFNIDKDADISGSYSIQAQIQTEQWTKTYTLIPFKTFAVTGKTVTFTQSIPINYTFYENILTKINTETGITASSPILAITSNVFVSAKTGGDNVTESFQFPITLSLNEKIIKISDVLSQSEPGTLTEKVSVFQQGVINERNNWTVYASIIAIILFAFALITTNDTKLLSETEKIIKKIKKKYGEAIVDVEKLPTSLNEKDVQVATLEDLIKISEELGKPIIHHKFISSVDQEEKHTFHVFDQNIHYEYALSNHEKIKKSVRCPKCGTKIYAEGYIGENIYVTCPACGNKGTISFEQKLPEQKSLEKTD